MPVSATRPLRLAAQTPAGMAITMVSRREESQRQGHRQACGYQIPHRHRVCIADAHIPLQQTCNPDQETFCRRAVKAHLAAQGLQRVGARLNAQHQLGRIAGDDFQNQEHCQCRRQQRQAQAHEPAQQEAGHAAILPDTED